MSSDVLYRMRKNDESRIEVGPSKEERAALLHGFRHFTNVRPSLLHCLTSIHKKKERKKEKYKHK